MATLIIYSDQLYHHGILGQKWGVRRFQNPDGTLTPAGEKRYLRQSPYYNHLNDAGEKKEKKVYDKVKKQITKNEDSELKKKYVDEIKKSRDVAYDYYEQEDRIKEQLAPKVKKQLNDYINNELGIRLDEVDDDDYWDAFVNRMADQPEIKEINRKIDEENQRTREIAKEYVTTTLNKIGSKSIDFVYETVPGGKRYSSTFANLGFDLLEQYAGPPAIKDYRKPLKKR